MGWSSKAVCPSAVCVSLVHQVSYTESGTPAAVCSGRRECVDPKWSCSRTQKCLYQTIRTQKCFYQTIRSVAARADF